MPVAGFYFTEEVGKLASKVSHAAMHDGRKVLMITSAAENEGKSTVAGEPRDFARAEGQGRVVLVDADLHKPAQYKLLRTEPKCELAQVLRGEKPCAPEQTEQKGLRAIFSTQARKGAAELLGGDGMRALLEHLRGEADLIIVDTPPMGMFSDAEAIAELADLSLLVVRQDCVPARHINDVLDALLPVPREAARVRL